MKKAAKRSRATPAVKQDRRVKQPRKGATPRHVAAETQQGRRGDSPRDSARDAAESMRSSSFTNGAAAGSEASRHSPSLPPGLDLWRSIESTANLSATLANIGTKIEANAAGESQQVPMFPFSALQAHHLRAALLSVVEAYTLLRHLLGDNDFALNEEVHAPHSSFRLYGEEGKTPFGELMRLGSDPSSVMPRVTHDQIGKQLILCLLSACDAAIPMAFPPLSPTLVSITDRRRRLLRLCHLKHAHTTLFPALQRCRSLEDVCDLLFASPPSGESLKGRSCAVALRPMPATLRGGANEAHAWGSQERAVVEELILQVNAEAAMDTSVWGFSIPPLSYVRGNFILSRRARYLALVKVLEEAELFGLPPFLRSIRRQDAPVAVGPGVGSAERSDEAPRAHRAASTHPGWPCSFGSGSASLFVTPEDLDPSAYLPPPEMGRILQDEINELTLSHCGFGMVVGEADQILLLLHQALSRRSAWSSDAAPAVPVSAALNERQPCGGHGLTDAARPSPLGPPEVGADDMLPFLVRDLLAASAGRSHVGLEGETSRKRPHQFVHWLCENRWHPTMSYFAAVLVAVSSRTDADVDGYESDSRSVASSLGLEELSQTRRSRYLDDAEHGHTTSRSQSVFYIAGVIELKREGAVAL